VRADDPANRREEPLEEELPDVDVSTSVRARELRFGVIPETSVSFEGEPAVRSSSRAERENLPDELEPGVTYRDIQVRWRARARIVPSGLALVLGLVAFAALAVSGNIGGANVFIYGMIATTGPPSMLPEATAVAVAGG
jgi:hypothetical protein